MAKVNFVKVSSLDEPPGSVAPFAWSDLLLCIGQKWLFLLGVLWLQNFFFFFKGFPGGSSGKE